MSKVSYSPVELIEGRQHGAGREANLVVAIVYFAICFGASRYSQWLERRLAAGAHR